MLAATAPTDFGGAVVAFMNPGGIRADLVCIADPAVAARATSVTYGEMFTVQPFGNVIVVKTCTGQQIYDLLAQQFNNPSAGAHRVHLRYRTDSRTATRSRTPIRPRRRRRRRRHDRPAR